MQGIFGSEYGPPFTESVVRQLTATDERTKTQSVVYFRKKITFVFYRDDARAGKFIFYCVFLVFIFYLIIDLYLMNL